MLFKIDRARVLRGIFFTYVISTIVGCANTNSVSPPPNIPGQQQGEPVGSSRESTTHEHSSSDSARATQSNTEKVVADLVRKGKQALSNKEPMVAIEQAERGIRIDRTEPELYLLLARAYDILGDASKAASFARQGLRYVTSNQFLLRNKLRAFTQN